MDLSKNLLRVILLIVAVAGLTLELVFANNLTAEKPIQSGWLPPKESVTKVRVQEKSTYGLPARLKITKINVDAAIEPVGITSQGELGSPEGPTTLAWYELGPRPGDIGSAVINGHFGYKDDIEAVFDNLNKLQTGDKIYIIDENGKTLTFAVTELRTYDQNEDAYSVFVSNDGKAHLNLITCQGVWNKALKSYSTRLVVFTDKEK